jgi:hypothetical protein
VKKGSGKLGSENIRDNSVYSELNSLVEEETALANGIFELSEKLEAEISSHKKNAEPFVESSRKWDKSIENALSAAVQKEAAWVGRLKRILAKAL